MYCGDGATTVIRTNENCCASPETSTLEPTDKGSKSDIYSKFVINLCFIAILIVSGCDGSCSDDSTRDVEALYPDGSWMCTLPSLPSGQGRFGASLAGSLMCGGTWDSNKQQSCYHFNESGLALWYVVGKLKNYQFLTRSMV